MSDKIKDLTEIATELLVAELERRAEAARLTTEELIERAKDNWSQAETKAEELKNL